MKAQLWVCQRERVSAPYCVEEVKRNPVERRACCERERERTTKMNSESNVDEDDHSLSKVDPLAVWPLRLLPLSEIFGKTSLPETNLPLETLLDLVIPCLLFKSQSTMSSSSTVPTEPRARRTHARRSCDLCKVRKTRCELPDLDVISSTEPLPGDKACHRCRVLALPCVVDDTNKRKRTLENGTKKNAAASGSKSKGQGSPKRKKLATNIVRDAISSVNHSVELMQSFDDDLDPSLTRTGSNNTPTGFGVIPNDQAGQTPPRERSMKYHARPYELVTAMLHVAYGRKRHIAPRAPLHKDLDIGKLVDEGMRARIAPA
jgi:hypothetical protein